MSYDAEFLGRIIEGALLSFGDALSVERLLSLFEEEERPERQEILDALELLKGQSTGRGYALVEVSSGWRFQVSDDLAPWVNRLWDEKPQKYSRALLETLALIAYRQPLTRSDIEEVRGVAVSSHIIKTLAEREWIKVVGNRDVPGRPALFATTRQFLDYFGLKSLDELPTLSELKDFDSLNQKLQLEDDEAALENDQIQEAKAGLASLSSEADIEIMDEIESLGEGDITQRSDLEYDMVDGAGSESEQLKIDMDAVQDEENSTPL